MSKVINDDNGVLIGIQVGHEIYDADDVERLVRECERQHAEIQRLKNELIRFVTEQTQRELIP